MQGKVKVNDRIVTKAGTSVPADAVITCAYTQPPFVCRAGLKLDAAIKHFNIPVTGLTALDSGLSTGGFTDCLLQHGATRVYGVDVGYGQVHEKIRTDPRVIIMERTNVRYLSPLPEQVDIVTLDLSFISVLKVLPAIMQSMKPHAHLVVLIKPQFEAKREQVQKGGLIKDPAVHQEVIHNVTTGIQQLGFKLVGVIDSPILGATGNKEFVSYFTR